MLIKEDNFCDFISAFRRPKTILKKESSLKEKNLVLRGANGSKFFSFRVDPFLEMI